MMGRGASWQLAAIAIIIGFTASVPASAEQSATPPQPKHAETKSFDDLVEQALGTDPRAAIHKLDAMLAQLSGKEERGFFLALRGAANIGIGKIDAASRDFDESRQLAPDDGVADNLRLIAGLVHKRYDQSSIALDQLLAGRTANVLAIDRPIMGEYLSNKKVSQEKLDDQRIELAKLYYGGADGVLIRLRAVRTLVSRGRRPEAIALVPKVDEVDVLQSALIDRRLESLWPNFEQSAGAHMATLITRNVTEAQAAFAERPSKADYRRRLMTALAAARRVPEALQRGAEIGQTPKALASLDEEDAWVVNDHAFALFRAGKWSDADRRFADLIQANTEKPWIVNMVINRVELLARVGNYVEADKLLGSAEPFGKAFGSPFAQQLIRRIKLCTAVGLKQTALVQRLLAELKAHIKDSTTATVEGLLCAGDAAAAEKVVLEQLADADTASTSVALLQSAPLTPYDPSLWAEAWPSLRQRPAVEAAFQKAGRDLPDLYHIK